MARRLIDMDALLQKLDEAGGCDAPKNSWADGYDSAINLAYKMTQEMPVVDACEIVHGEWRVGRRLSDWEELKTAECSVCGYYDILNVPLEKFKKFYPYCAHCGAKMDGERGSNAKSAY